MEAPGAGRALVRDEPEGLTVVLPAPRVWPVIGFLLFWLTGWFAGESFAVRQLLGPSPGPARAFLALWLAFWTLGGSFAIAVCAWMLAGHERVRLAPDALVVKNEVLGFGPARRYELDRVTDLRAQTPDLAAMATASPAAREALARAQARGGPAPDVRGVLRVVGIASPGITFRYGGRPVRFGTALDPAEAAQIAALLRSRHAFPGDIPVA